MSTFKKAFFLISTGVCGAIGITMIVLGTKEILDEKYIQGFDNAHTYVIAVFISLGVIIFVISATGFLGVILHKSYLLRTYAYMMLALVMVQVFICFIILLLIDVIRNALHKKLNEKYKDYKHNKNDIDQLQLVLQCCGLSGARNWNESLPASCCGLKMGNCTVNLAYVDSCSEKSDKMIVHTLYIMSIGSLLVVLFEIKCIILACCLSNVESLKDEEYEKRKRLSDASSRRSSSSSSSSSSEDKQKKK